MAIKPKYPRHYPAQPPKDNRRKSVDVDGYYRRPQKPIAGNSHDIVSHRPPDGRRKTVFVPTHDRRPPRIAQRRR